jgi:branched-subunit amino acid aminotransferase/4-amino-4-deoxychorismate lyase
MADQPRSAGLSIIEIEGEHVSEEVAAAALASFGHFTAMQVRGSRTRGLALHLRRLEAANRELFDADLDGEHVRSLIRHALGDIEDASVRVYLLESDADPTTVVTVKPPGGVQSPQHLRSVGYQRPRAHLKHLRTEQGRCTAVARAEGFDDALLIADDGTVSESATANIGFFDETGVVWPDAPLLHGITMQLLEARLPQDGMTSRRATVRLTDIPSFEGAFLSYARGVAAVSGVDEMLLADRELRMTALAEAYDSVAWDAI